MSEKLSKFLIDTQDPRYWLYDLTDGGETVHQLTWPEGTMEKNEISDTIYRDGEVVPYHEHRKGVETFLIHNGTVDVTIRGKHCVVGEGDMLHIPPFTPHGFTYHTEGMTWRECFQEINMSGSIANKCRIKDNYGEELYFEPEFRKRYLSKNQDIQREPPVAADVDKYDLHEVRPHDFGLSVFDIGKVTFRQKVGRWETHGVKEVWQILAEKGVSFEFNDPYGDSEIFLIYKGKTHWKVLDEEFDAGAECFVKIPPYCKYEMEVLEDGTEIIDYGSSILLNDMLEDYMSIHKNDPTRFDDPAELKHFLRKYNCFMTGCKLGE